MKIVFCINSLVKGGAERVVSNLSNYLTESNDVHIITMINYDIAYKLNDNIKVYSLDKKRKNFDKTNSNLISKIYKFINRRKKMKKLITKIDPDVIVSFLPESSYLALSCKRKRDKIIVSVRNDPKIEYSSKIYYFLMKKLYPKADGFIFQTSEAKDYFKNIINCDSDIIPNPINKDFICERFNGNRKNIITSVGRLTEQKNYELLIDAFAESQDYLQDYKLIIYGEGEKRKVLEKKIKEYKLEKNIILPGIVNNVKEKIFDSSMFILPSLYEGMPNALMEAMAIGLPVISSDCPCGGPRELIKDGISGLLFEVGNKEDLKNKMKILVENKEFANNLGVSASKIINTHNPDILNEKWKNFIVKIIRNGD